MKKTSKVIRIITISPIMVASLLFILYFGHNSFFKNNTSYIIALLTLVILPILAYPIQRRFKLLKRGTDRENERMLSIIFSVIGYVIGFILALVLKTPNTEKILYLTYLFSGILIFVFSHFVKINASGHMAGISGPVAIIVYLFGYQYLILIGFVILVGWSSLKLNRHTVNELVFGSLIPLVSLIISFLIFK